MKGSRAENPLFKDVKDVIKRRPRRLQRKLRKQPVRVDFMSRNVTCDHYCHCHYHGVARS